MVCMNAGQQGGRENLYRLAKQRDRDGKDVQQARVIRDRWKCIDRC